jgi:hypothetical protein
MQTLAIRKPLEASHYNLNSSSLHRKELNMPRIKTCNPQLDLRPDGLFASEANGSGKVAEPIDVVQIGVDSAGAHFLVLEFAVLGGTAKLVLPASVLSLPPARFMKFLLDAGYPAPPQQSYGAISDLLAQRRPTVRVQVQRRGNTLALVNTDSAVPYPPAPLDESTDKIDPLASFAALIQSLEWSSSGAAGCGIKLASGDGKFRFYVSGQLITERFPNCEERKAVIASAEREGWLIGELGIISLGIKRISAYRIRRKSILSFQTIDA